MAASSGLSRMSLLTCRSALSASVSMDVVETLRRVPRQLIVRDRMIARLKSVCCGSCSGDAGVGVESGITASFWPDWLGLILEANRPPALGGGERRIGGARGRKWGGAGWCAGSASVPHVIGVRQDVLRLVLIERDVLAVPFVPAFFENPARTIAGQGATPEQQGFIGRRAVAGGRGPGVEHVAG